MRKPPAGMFSGEFSSPGSGIVYRATGEFRPPKKGEYYLSGAIITAYRALADYDLTSFWIAEQGIKKVTTTVEFFPLKKGRITL